MFPCAGSVALPSTSRCRSLATQEHLFMGLQEVQPLNPKHKQSLEIPSNHRGSGLVKGFCRAIPSPNGGGPLAFSCKQTSLQVSMLYICGTCSSHSSSPFSNPLKKVWKGPYVRIPKEARTSLHRAWKRTLHILKHSLPTYAAEHRLKAWTFSHPSAERCEFSHPEQDAAPCVPSTLDRLVFAQACACPGSYQQPHASLHWRTSRRFDAHL